MAEFRDILSQLKVKTVRLCPGNMTPLWIAAKLTRNSSATCITHSITRVHFMVLDNVSDPMAAVGEKQLQWLRADLQQMKNDARIVVLTHRPLFDLAPDWDCIQNIINIINGAIRSALNVIRTVARSIEALHQQVVWPIRLIDQARRTIAALVDQFRGLLNSIYGAPVTSATFASASA
jgi:hypothetical protein